MNKIPISRLGKFYRQEDFDLDMELIQEYLHGDLNFTFILYRVDRTAPSDDIYGEATTGAIKFHSPIEIHGMIEIETPDNKEYKSGTPRFMEAGNLTINVLKVDLATLGVDIMYGDYIGYLENEDRIRYYSVTNDGKIANDNRHTIGGYKSFFRTIVCSPVQEGEFQA